MSTPAVKVLNASKSYRGGQAVLNDLNMQVDQGTIYCLLGESGCGKTTLLSCIVGNGYLDSGEVKVFGVEPGKPGSGIPGKVIGYMPQNIALYDIFTIKEVLCYFGNIYGMSTAEIRVRTEFLRNFLSLPDSSDYIKNLSGGQQRRTSFAVSMIHEPQLLILDEPTVGVDPLLRERIWGHLCDIVMSKGTTVIVTTHYFEEARQCQRVGLMRHGRLLAEKHPYELMKEHDSVFLEDVVLKLCRNDVLGIAEKNMIEYKGNDTEYRKSGKLSQVFVDTQISVQTKSPVVGLKYQTRSPDYSTLRTRRENSQIEDTKEGKSKTVIKHAINEYKKISSVLKRNFLLHFRQPVFVIVQLIIPTLQIIIFNCIMGSEPYGLKIAVVNNELPMQNNQTFLDYCVRDLRNNSCFEKDLSCSFFEMFEKDQVDWRPVKSETDALESVHQGKTMGFITIPHDFAKQTQTRLLHKQFVSNESIVGSTISARLDFSNKLNSGYLIKEFHERYLMFLQESVRLCGEDPRFVTLPLKYNAIYGSVKGGWAEFFQPAFILWIIFLIPTAYGIIYVSDVKAGTMDRTLVAGVGYHHLLISIIISEGAMTLIQLGLCFIVLLYGFNFQVVGSLSLCIFMCFLMGMIGVTLGLLIGTMCKNEMEVIMAIAAIYMITVPASGGVWPLAGVLNFYRVVSYMVPVTVPLESIRSVVNRGWGLEHPMVWGGVLVMLGWISMCCILSAIFHHLRK